ncbi:EAL domain-containing protein [bacterium]|nr:EAL domain-containing protein [bacterium]
MKAIAISLGSMPWIANRASENIEDAEAAIEYMLAINDIATHINMQTSEAMDYLGNGGRKHMVSFLEYGVYVDLSIERAINAIQKQMEAGIEGEKEDLEKLKNLGAIYLEILGFIEKAMDISEQGRRDEAYQIVEDKVEPMIDGSLNEIINDAIRDAKAEFTGTNKDLFEMLTQVTFTSSIILAALILILILIALNLIRNITSSLLLLRNGAEHIASGNLDYRIKLQGGYELKRVAHSFNLMADELREKRQRIGSIMFDLEVRNKELEISEASLRCSSDELSELNALLSEEVITRKKQEERIAQMAYYDGLTDLPNRTMFEDHMKNAISLSEQFNGIFAVMFIDVDNFKRINDTLGHSSGDQLLISIADRINRAIRKSDPLTGHSKNTIVARLGGDEFTVLLPELKDVDDARKVADRIINAFSMPVILDHTEIFASISIGIALYPKDGKDIETLLKNADAAMYYTKDHGKNSYHYYEESMNAASLTRLTFEVDLRRALLQEEFLLHYQPIVDAATGRISVVEALIRWEQPGKGMISPVEFIPVAEQSGMILKISEWVIRAACKQLMIWKKAGITHIPIAINLTNHQFQQTLFVNELVQVLQEFELSTADLHLEITENTIMENTGIAVSNLHALSEMGFRLVIDDFGTGYSSLSYLNRFPIHAIKIDRSFVSEIDLDPNTAAISDAIISMAHSLNLRVVGEGVETEQQVRVLRQQKCDELQGYLFSKPLPAKEITELLLREKKEKGVFSIV